MKRPFFAIIFLVTIITSILVSVATLRFMFPGLLSQYSISSPGISSEKSASAIPPGATASLKQVEAWVKAIAKKMQPSVVNIIINKDIQLYRTDPYGFFYEPSGTVRRTVGGGTWFFITKDGLILTNKHVVSEPDATYTIITSDHEEFVAKILAIDPLADLAIIRAVTKDGKNISDRIPVELVSDQKNVDVGTFVIAMGNALAEFQNTLTFGVISGLWRTIEAGNQVGGNVEELSGLLQTDAAINPGNSGGPLVDLDGKVIGINTAIAAWANGLGFAIPLSSRDVDYLLASLAKYNTIKRPFLGIKYAPITEGIARANKLKSLSGDLILTDGIVVGSPAEKSGLQPGDIIIEAEWKAITDGFDVKDALTGKMPGDTVRLTIIPADGEKKKIEVKLGSI